MVDLTDDWMNPRTSSSWSSTSSNKKQFRIERERRVPVTGNVAYIRRWDLWSSYDTPEERDRAYDRLCAEHPAWHLRKKDYDPLLDRHMGQMLAR